MPALARPRRRARRLGATARELLLLVGVSAAVFLALLVIGRASAAFAPPSISLSVAPADGGRLEVSGSATAIPQGLAINGRDGSATVVPPRNFEETIVVTATESRGVSQTSTFATRRLSSTIKTLAGISVSAEGAMGVKLVALRLDRRRLRTERFVHVALRVEDRRGYLIRGARVRLQALPRRSLAGAPVRWEVTDLLGRSELGLTLRHGAFRTVASRRVAFVVRVTTPRATATRRVPLVLPALPAV